MCNVISPCNVFGQDSDLQDSTSLFHAVMELMNKMGNVLSRPVLRLHAVMFGGGASPATGSKCFVTITGAPTVPGTHLDARGLSCLLRTNWTGPSILTNLFFWGTWGSGLGMVDVKSHLRWDRALVPRSPGVELVRVRGEKIVPPRLIS